MNFVGCSMSESADCKGCRANVRLPEREIDRIIADYLKTHDDRVVDDSTYQQRLSACRTCTHLQYGTTCSFCGCLVALRAKLAGKSCPNPTPLWTSKEG